MSLVEGAGGGGLLYCVRSESLCYRLKISAYSWQLLALWNGCGVCSSCGRTGFHRLLRVSKTLTGIHCLCIIGQSTQSSSLSKRYAAIRFFTAYQCIHVSTSSLSIEWQSTSSLRINLLRQYTLACSVSTCSLSMRSSIACVSTP